MVGIIVNWYARQSSQVEIIEVASVENGCNHLVNRREFEGGKVHLNTFAPDTLQQTSNVVIRGTLTRDVRQLVAA